MDGAIEEVTSLRSSGSGWSLTSFSIFSMSSWSMLISVKGSVSVSMLTML